LNHIYNDLVFWLAWVTLVQHVEAEHLVESGSPLYMKLLSGSPYVTMVTDGFTEKKLASPESSWRFITGRILTSRSLVQELAESGNFACQSIRKISREQVKQAYKRSGAILLLLLYPFDT
jgi:hypothetical protein